MKKIISAKNKLSTSILKNCYCITIKNASKRTKGNGGYHSESIQNVTYRN